MDKAICIKVVDRVGFVHGGMQKVWSGEATSLGVCGRSKESSSSKRGRVH